MGQPRALVHRGRLRRVGGGVAPSFGGHHRSGRAFLGLLHAWSQPVAARLRLQLPVERWSVGGRRD